MKIDQACIRSLMSEYKYSLQRMFYKHFVLSDLGNQVLYMQFELLSLLGICNQLHKSYVELLYCLLHNKSQPLMHQ